MRLFCDKRLERATIRLEFNFTFSIDPIIIGNDSILVYKIVNSEDFKSRYKVTYLSFRKSYPLRFLL